MEELCGPYLHSPFSPFSLTSPSPPPSPPLFQFSLLSTMEETRTYKTLITRSGSSSVNGVAGVSSSSSCCQAEQCTADLSAAKRYHRRHKVCEFHSKSPVVIVAGLRQRFCQQCSRFHELSEFDETKRSCRSRLAGHNERRRKSSSDSHGEGSSSKGVNPELKENHYRQANQSGTRITFTAGNTKHFQIS